MKNALFLFITLICFNCNHTAEKTDKINENTSKITKEANEKAFNEVLIKHLNAVSNKDLETLKSTLSPDGNMQLILPTMETTYTADAFMEYHKQWFAAPIEWTFETKVNNVTIGETIGMAVVDIVYREPLRDNKPYFNRMVVSYDLQKMDGQWYFIKDHASSIEKSTD